MGEEIDPEVELERLRMLPIEERSEKVEELIQRLEAQLEERSPGPPVKSP